MGTILTCGKIVNSDKTIESDIRIENGIITEIAKNIIAKKNDEVINVKGSYIMPGGIDTHTHFDLDTGTMKTADDFKSGTMAAICGGTTTFLDFATQNKGGTLEDALIEWQEKAKNVSFCDYGFHMAITDWNTQTSKSMQAMVDSGVSSFKMYMAYKGTLQVNDSEIYEGLKRSKEVSGLVGFHCENGDIIVELVSEYLKKGNTEPKYHALSRPSTLEAEAISRVTKIAGVLKAPLYIVHLSSELGYDEAMRAKKAGVEVYLESCPQYLVLDKSKYEATKNEKFNGAKYVMSPPLREVSDNNVLWKGIQDGNIEVIGTDHCSFNYKGQKEIGKDDFSQIPNGGPGVEHRMLVMYQSGVVENRISINKYVDLTSTRAAKMFGMYPNKGVIAIGSQADILVLNPNKKFTITKENQHQNVDYTPYDGFNVDGNIDYVFLNGEKIVVNNNLDDKKPKGKFVKRNPFKGEC